VTPQANFMVAAPVAPGREAELRALLATMNASPGVADPSNDLVPFGRLEGLHVARFVILEDETVGDIAAYGGSLPDLPIYLVFLGDCDGGADAFLQATLTQAGPGLRRIFAHCVAFSDDADLGAWMRRHAVRPSTAYVNWVGRTVTQVREEQRLHTALVAALNGVAAGADPVTTWRALKDSPDLRGVKLSPPPPTPFAWLFGHWARLVASGLALIVLAPLLLVLLPLFLIVLRWREGAEPGVAQPADAAKRAAIAAYEDHDVANAFTAIGTLKPGLFRLALAVFALWSLDLTCRYLYVRGRLARVGTIHFARWVFLDGARRLLFASNYDGGLDAYMDDFINKAGFGLNAVFSNGIGYPRTRWLLWDGASNEEAFKAFLHRHQVLTDVWYRAYPGLTTLDLARNSRIRAGYERDAMSEADAARWLALI
jgi:hypothetical protein